LDISIQQIGKAINGFLCILRINLYENYLFFGLKVKSHFKPSINLLNHKNPLI